MKTAIRSIGNAQGVIIPKAVLGQTGLRGEAEMTVENGAIVLRKPAAPARAGWSDAARRVAQAQDDCLVMGDFANAGDADLSW